VLLGSVLSSLFAGMVADLIGRRGAMLLAGLLFTASIPIMALASGYTPLLLGRLLQGVSGGLIGVVVPLYLAEVLSPERRGRGAAMFQLLLTIGLVLAALIGLYQAHAVDAAAEAVRSLPLAQQAQELFVVKDHAWRTIFWSCLAPGLLFCAGIFWLSWCAAVAWRTRAAVFSAYCPLPMSRPRLRRSRHRNRAAAMAAAIRCSAAATWCRSCWPAWCWPAPRPPASIRCWPPR